MNPVLGVTIYLDANNNGNFDPGEINTTTDGAGGYNLTNLPPNTAANPYQRECSRLAVPSTPLLPDIVVTHAQHVTNQDIGNFRAFSISGTVFQDVNGNGIRNPSDGGLQNFKVNLLFYPTAGGPAQIAQTTTTVAGGSFTFNNIGPSFNGVRGSYRVVQDLTPNPGWIETTPPPAHSPPVPIPSTAIPAASGGAVGGLLFGDFGRYYHRRRFNDLNGDGIGKPAMQVAQHQLVHRCQQRRVL